MNEIDVLDTNKQISVGAPGIESNNILDFKGVSFTPALTALLSPTTQFLGNEIKGGVEALVNTLKEKVRAKNLEKHIHIIKQEAEKRDIKLDFNSVEQLDLFSKWAESAQDVSPDSEVISNAWQEALLKIMQKDFNEHLLNKLKSLEKEEFELLLDIKHKKHIRTINEKQSFYCKSLYDKDLVNKISHIPFYISSLLVTVLCFYFLIKDTNIGNITDIFVMLSILFCASIALFFSFRRKRLETWYLSWLGRELIEKIT